VLRLLISLDGTCARPRPVSSFRFRFSRARGRFHPRIARREKIGRLSSRRSPATAWHSRADGILPYVCARGDVGFQERRSNRSIASSLIGR